MPKLFVLCGLPGSGKSSWAQAHPQYVTVSSDAIRAELYGHEETQGDPQEVFAEMDKRVSSLLDEGKDVIYDATNISAKIRKNIIAKFPQATPICIFLDTPVKECIKRNLKRKRHVPEHIIMRMNKNLEPPTAEENFTIIEKIS